MCSFGMCRYRSSVLALFRFLANWVPIGFRKFSRNFNFGSFGSILVNKEQTGRGERCGHVRCCRWRRQTGRERRRQCAVHYAGTAGWLTSGGDGTASRTGGGWGRDCVEDGRPRGDMTTSGMVGCAGTRPRPTRTGSRGDEMASTVGDGGWVAAQA
jgi:hypothetical protein